MELSFTTIRNYLPSLPPSLQKQKKMHYCMHRYISDLSSTSKIVYTSVFILTLGCCLTGIIWYVWKRSMVNPSLPPVQPAQPILPPGQPSPQNNAPAQPVQPLPPPKVHPAQPIQPIQPPPPNNNPIQSVRRPRTEEPPPPIKTLPPVYDVELGDWTEEDRSLLNKLSTGESEKVIPLQVADSIVVPISQIQVYALLDQFFLLYQDQTDSDHPINLKRLFASKDAVIDCILGKFHGESLFYPGKKKNLDQRRTQLQPLFLEKFKKLPMSEIKRNRQFTQYLKLKTLQGESPDKNILKPFLTRVENLSLAGFVGEVRTLTRQCPAEQLCFLSELTKEMLLIRSTGIQNIHGFALFLKATDEAFILLQDSIPANQTDIPIHDYLATIRAGAIRELLTTPLILTFEEFRQLHHSIRFFELDDQHRILARALFATLQDLPIVAARTAFFERLQTLPFITTPILAKSAITFLKAFHQQYLAQPKVEGAAPFHLPDFHKCLITVQMVLPEDLSFDDQEAARKIFNSLTELSNGFEYRLLEITPMREVFKIVKEALGSDMELEIQNATEDDAAYAQQAQQELDQEAGNEQFIPGNLPDDLTPLELAMILGGA